MSEEVVGHSHWMQIVHPCVHVETGLDVVFGNALVFELLCRSSLGV